MEEKHRWLLRLQILRSLQLLLLLYLLETTLGERKLPGFARAFAFLAIACLALWQARTVPPDYLYPEHAEYNAALEKYADDPCVLFAEPEDAFMPMTEGLIQLLTFPEVYVTDERSLSPMLDYVGDADELVVYIDTSKFWSSGYDADALLRRIAEESDYDRAEALFTTGLSTTYVVSR